MKGTHIMFVIYASHTPKDFTLTISCPTLNIPSFFMIPLFVRRACNSAVRGIFLAPDPRRGSLIVLIGTHHINILVWEPDVASILQYVRTYEHNFMMFMQLGSARLGADAACI